MGNHRDPKQETRRQQQREKRLRIPEAAAVWSPRGRPEPGAKLLQGRGCPPFSSLQFLQVPSVVAETPVSFTVASWGQTLAFSGCSRTKITQAALVVFLLLLKRPRDSLFSTKKSLLSGQELAWRIFQLRFPASLSAH